MERREKVFAVFSPVFLVFNNTKKLEGLEDSMKDKIFVFMIHKLESSGICIAENKTEAVMKLLHENEIHNLELAEGDIQIWGYEEFKIYSAGKSYFTDSDILDITLTDWM